MRSGLKVPPKAPAYSPLPPPPLPKPKPKPERAMRAPGVNLRPIAIEIFLDRGRACVVAVAEVVLDGRCHGLERVVVGVLDLLHLLRRVSGLHLCRHVTRSELSGIEDEAAMARPRRRPCDLRGPRQRIVQRDVARFLLGILGGQGIPPCYRRRAFRPAARLRQERHDPRVLGWFLAWRGDLNWGGGAVKRRERAEAGAKNKERRSFAAPPPCAMSSLTPVRDDQSGNRETFRSLDHALGFMVSHEAAA